MFPNTLRNGLAAHLLVINCVQVVFTCKLNISLIYFCNGVFNLLCLIRQAFFRVATGERYTGLGLVVSPHITSIWSIHKGFPCQNKSFFQSALYLSRRPDKAGHSFECVSGVSGYCQALYMIPFCYHSLISEDRDYLLNHFCSGCFVTIGPARYN